MALNKRKATKELTKELEKNYLLQGACNKLGLTRSTVYRWMQENEEFAVKLRTAQAIGRRSMSDYVESKLLKNIGDHNQRAIEFWLKCNNEHYRSNEKALDRQIDSLKDQLKQGRAALAAIGSDSLFKRFVDWPKVEEYMNSPEWRERQAQLNGIYRGHSAHEKEILDQVQKILRQIKMAEHITKIGGIPNEQVELVD